MVTDTRTLVYHRLAVCLSGLFLSLSWSVAGADFGNYLQHTHDGFVLSVETTLGVVTLTPVDDAAIEIHYQERGVSQLPSFAIAEGNQPLPSHVSESPDALTLALPGIEAVIEKSPFRIAYQAAGDPLVAEERGYIRSADGIGFRFKLDSDEQLAGGGQRVLGMNRRGHRLPLYNKAAYGYGDDPTPQMYYGLPAVFSSKKYIVVFDNSASGWMDIGATDAEVLSFEAAGGRSAYLIVAGDSYPSLLHNYVDVTGRQPLPPRWAFGNFASRFGYRSEREVRDVVRRFRRQKIPLDGAIIDIYWFGPDIKGHMGNLAWEPQAWPSPEKLINDLADDGVNTIVVTEPFVLSTSKQWQSAVDAGVLAKTASGEPRRFDFYFGNTGLIDVFDERARRWFWQAYDELFAQGIAGTWGDLGEPEVHPDDAIHHLSDHGLTATGAEVHNAFGHRWAQMVFERQRARDPDVRPLILMRSGFAGSQRYGMIPWTGDVDRSFRGLKPQVELSLQMGLLGLAYTHSDLGGFAGGERFDRELYIRWLQYGAFQPVYRPHAQDHIAPEPVFHDRRTRRIVRDFIELRYRLLPYNYSLAYQNSLTGMPLMRPLFFEDENAPELFDRTDAYLWGDAFLVAPVTGAGVREKTVGLPEGVWFNYWTDERLEGGRNVTVPAPLNTLPILVRGGSFVPMAELVQTTRDYSTEKLELHYYADSTVTHSAGSMYEDDGHSPEAIEQSAFEELHFDATHTDDALRIDLRRSGGNYPGRPERRVMDIVIHNWTEPVESIRFDGAPIELVRRLPSHASGASAARRDARSNTLTVRVSWDHRATSLVVNSTVTPLTKPVVYQTMTRLFGNKTTTNTPWGTIEENGVGKFADFDDAALRGIRELGTSHVWFTGVPHHALIQDYTEYGISNDDPDVVKGRAGSPYAVKDYYNVNPVLAVDPARRLEEFEALIERTHQHGMKVIIDIVPNHVARNYESLSGPPGSGFGVNDDPTQPFSPGNDFYYVVGQDFLVPEHPDGYAPLGGAPHPLADGKFAESPARWTGNGARRAQPRFDDWFETVKINYGVRPDGSHTFVGLPEAARDWSNDMHAEFWRDREVPDSWKKFRDITLYWIAKGVDGFRYDMAELVPVEFWSYLNSSIKQANPDAFLLAEVYNPKLYRDYLALGRMDYLYDKVGLYDTLKLIIQGKLETDAIAKIHAEVLDVEEHMLHFLENHDEHRIASAAFAGDPRRALPAMVVSALISRSPTLIYFGQEVGESGDGDAGFGDPMRTTIFDYWGVPAHQRWMNGGKFDGGALTANERSLRDYYVELLTLSAEHPAMQGRYEELQTFNRQHNETYDDRLFSFARWTDQSRLLVVSNFDGQLTFSGTIAVPPDLIEAWGLANGDYLATNQLSSSQRFTLRVRDGQGTIQIQLAPLESFVLEVGNFGKAGQHLSAGAQ